MNAALKPLVIYHADCADGFGAAYAAWLVYGDTMDYVPMQYGQVQYNAQDRCFVVGDTRHSIEDRTVYILDFSFPKPVMDDLFHWTGRVVWLDHHKTAFEMWDATERTYLEQDNGNDYVLLDNTRSGTMLAWAYFHPDQGPDYPQWVKHIDDYDRWQFKLEGTKEFNKGLWARAPWVFGKGENGWLDMTCNREQLIVEGTAVLRAHNQNVQAVAQGASGCYLLTDPVNTVSAGHHGLMVNCPAHLTSDVGHELATQCGTYGLCWYMGKDGMIKGSLRSNGDYDVSTLAKALGGGGHKNAAGFTTDIGTLLTWMKGA